jgi:aspartyl-tRNA(Asn)/glutamyl-tRNA(Gln) amidotransferase subunit B
MFAWEAVIGLEVHAQLLTQTKLFCGCPTTFGAPPNTHVCPTCLGLPGALPALNAEAVRMAVRTALALGCAIRTESRFARKNYFYPDLPKGYQISQFDEPFAGAGVVEVPLGGGEVRRARIQRIHMEEDAGKNVHLGDGDLSLIDYNRAGAPLVEIVSLPALRSAAEAADYVRELRTIVRYLGVSEANMEEGTLRCDANVSLRRWGAPELGTRCEIKNLNSFKFLEAAIEAEVRRQADLLDRGERIIQSTLSYDPARDQTKVMRSKEEAADYRYFPEPDMPPLLLDPATLAAIRAKLPALPWDRRRRLVGLGLSAYDAGVLTAERELCDYFDAVVAIRGEAEAKTACNWITGELLRLLNATKLGTSQDLGVAACPLAPAALAELLELLAAGTLSGRAAKAVLDKAFAEGLSPAAIVERDGYRQVSDTGAIAAIVREVVANNTAQFEQLLAGKDKVRGFFVGQVMRASNGQANPQIVNEVLDQLVAERSAPESDPA